MKSNTYWKNRAAQRMYEYQKNADDVADDVTKAYIKATDYISSEVSKIFRTFQIDCGISEEDAKKLLDNLPDEVSLNNLREVVQTIEDSQARQEMLNVINSPAYVYRIRRLESLQNDIDTQINDIAKLEENITTAHYKELMDYAYNRTLFDIQRGTGIGFAFDKMSKSRVNEILKHNWSGQLFSERIWGNTDKINIALKRELLTGFMTGRSYNKTAKAIQEQMEVGAYEARRLVRTESTYIANSTEIESYKNIGADKYRFIATLDIRTSKICASMDGRVFDVEDAVPGENIPPLHPWCRSTTIAELDEEIMNSLTRAARDPVTGEQYTVPANMTYEEWKQEVDKKSGDGTFEKMQKMYINEKSDREQYEKYISILGKDNMPETFDKFQVLKYNDIEKWSFVKLDYSRQLRLKNHPELALPNAKNVYVDDRKYTGYLFNPSSAKGYAKGKAFTSRLGYDINNFEELKKCTVLSAPMYPTKFVCNNGYGDQYEQKIVLYGLKDKPANVIVGWIVNGTETKLTSMYIKER